MLRSWFVVVWTRRFDLRMRRSPSFIVFTTFTRHRRHWKLNISRPNCHTTTTRWREGSHTRWRWEVVGFTRRLQWHVQQILRLTRRRWWSELPGCIPVRSFTRRSGPSQFVRRLVRMLPRSEGSLSFAMGRFYFWVLRRWWCTMRVPRWWIHLFFSSSWSRMLTINAILGAVRLFGLRGVMMRLSRRPMWVVS